MRGEVRLGMKAGIKELQRAFPLQGRDTLDAAAAVIGTVVAPSLGWSQAQNIGLATQKRYGALVQRLLDIASADVLRSAPQHLSRLLAILEMCSEELGPATGIGGLWWRKGKPKALEVHRNELDQLKATLSAAMSALEAPMNDVMAIRDDLAALADELMATGLACEWLSQRKEFAPEVACVLVDRALSLTKTAGLARQEELRSKATAIHLDALRDRIQDGVLIGLPTWLAGQATLAVQPGEPNETQRFVARDELQLIIDRLKN
ncbi:hypothetical protein VLK31_11360 [Variovorax sp. H27-G14]|uniref:hypothetical protein n=1 Tax=Variovorax sp. H27-G14 TaxID=3111914 RepID=UPI0038FCDF37